MIRCRPAWLFFTAIALVPLCSASIPLYFEQNQGQTDRRVDYIARGDGYVVFLTNKEAVLKPAGTQPLTMHLLGADGKSTRKGLQRAPGVTHYLGGARNLMNVSHFGRVQYSDIYPGIDIVYYGQGAETRI